MSCDVDGSPGRHTMLGVISRRSLGTGRSLPPISVPPRPTCLTLFPASASPTSTSCATAACSAAGTRRGRARGAPSAPTGEETPEIDGAGRVD